MKKIIFLSMSILIFVSNTFAWQFVQGKVKRVWVNGWSSEITFELVPNSGYSSCPTAYGVNPGASDVVKNRSLAVLLLAQTSSQDVFVYFNPNTGSGPIMYTGDGSGTSTYGTQSISIVP
jgi:hypothetical protein